MRYYAKVDEGVHGWGDPTWYLEVDAGGDAVRQIALYPNGCVLWYSADRREDEYGALAVMVVDGDADRWAPYEISRAAFERVWQAHRAVITTPTRRPAAR